MPESILLAVNKAWAPGAKIKADWMTASCCVALELLLNVAGATSVTTQATRGISVMALHGGPAVESSSLSLENEAAILS